MLSFAALLVSVQSQTSVTSKLYDVGVPIEVFQYLPKRPSGSNLPVKKLIVVMHGTNRNADEYCEHARILGDQFGAMVIAPKFDEARFPSWRYHRGGVLDGKGRAQLRQDRTYAMLRKVIRMVMAENGLSEYWMIGHSAGGQFLNRLAAFEQFDAKRIIVANPGTLVFPRTDWKFAYGFGGLPEYLSDRESIEAYLAAPMTLYLGTADNKKDEYLDVSQEAMRQGSGRFQRGSACFYAAKDLAQRWQVPFNWKMVWAPLVDHDHEKMFAAKEITTVFEQ